MIRRFRLTSLLSVAPLVPFFLAALGRSTESLSVWDEIYKSAWAGIYTDNQAIRGENFYKTRCATCHGVSLEGSEDAPPLAGPGFVLDWNCANIADLFEKIQYTMPANRPGGLNDQQVAEVLSYILKVNRFPAGASALSENVDDLRGLMFLAVDPRP
jgi:S-disulfanyl-L-cysteine oxidoreductase SoxD